MKYDSNHFYRIAYIITVIVFIPFFILLIIKDEPYKSPLIILLTAVIIGMEYSFSFPRQAMKLYENILFKSFIEKNSSKIQLFIIVGLSISQIFYLIKENGVLLILPMTIFIIIHLIWSYLLQKHSILIGDKNIIIGRTLISHDSIKSISKMKKKIIIKTDGKNFILYKWILGNKKDELDLVLDKII